MQPIDINHTGAAPPPDFLDEDTPAGHHDSDEPAHRDLPRLVRRHAGRNDADHQRSDELCLAALHGRHPGGADAAGRLRVRIAALAFRSFLLCNPQIRVKQFDMDWDALLASAPAMVLMNHASYFDFFLFTSILPFRVILNGHVRTVMSASLTKLPIVGKPIGDHAGSFKVYFQAKGAGFGTGNESDFSVDREKQQRETDRMKSHIEAERGILAFCPEGGMNKTPQDGLKPFRRGSFAQAAEFRTPIWGAALHGCTDAWPRRQDWWLPVHRRRLTQAADDARRRRDARRAGRQLAGGDAAPVARAGGALLWRKGAHAVKNGRERGRESRVCVPYADSVVLHRVRMVA